MVTIDKPELIMIAISFILLFLISYVMLNFDKRQPSEAFKLDVAAVKFCNKLHYPVDLNFEAWKQCLKEFDD